MLTRAIKKHIQPILAKFLGKILWPVGYVVIVAEKNGEIAVLKSDKYELPAGMVKFGESPTEAAKRELKEETGLETTKMNHKDSRAFEMGIMHVFKARVDGEPTSRTWEGEPVFIDKKELGKLEWRQRHRRIVEEMKQN